MASTITAPVGLHGENQSDDVRTIQALLNGVFEEAGGPEIPLVVDGVVGPKTARAISTFQLQQFGFADGLVEPGLQTLQKLNELQTGLRDTLDTILRTLRSALNTPLPQVRLNPALRSGLDARRQQFEQTFVSPLVRDSVAGAPLFVVQAVGTVVVILAFFALVTLVAVAAAGPNARAVDIDRIRREIDKQMARLFAELTRVQFAALFTIAESLAFLEELVGKEIDDLIKKRDKCLQQNPQRRPFCQKEVREVLAVLASLQQQFADVFKDTLLFLLKAPQLPGQSSAGLFNKRVVGFQNSMVNFRRALANLGNCMGCDELRNIIVP